MNALSDSGRNRPGRYPENGGNRSRCAGYGALVAFLSLLLVPQWDSACRAEVVFPRISLLPLV